MPSFLEAFPEVKEMLRKWANSNLDQLSCENVQLEIKNNMISQVYTTYLEDCDSGYDPLSQDYLLYLFGLKRICLKTVWKWIKFIGFSYNERQKSWESNSAGVSRSNSAKILN